MVLSLQPHFEVLFVHLSGLILLSTEEMLEPNIHSQLINTVQQNIPTFIITDETADREMETDSPTELTGILPPDLVRPQTDLSGAMLREILEPEHLKETAYNGNNLKVSIIF